MISNVSKFASSLWNGICSLPKSVWNTKIGKSAVCISLFAGCCVVLRKLCQKVSCVYKDYSVKQQEKQAKKLEKRRLIQQKKEEGLCICDCSCGNLEKVNDVFTKHKSCVKDESLPERTQFSTQSSSSMFSSSSSSSSGDTSIFDTPIIDKGLEEPVEHKENVKKKIPDNRVDLESVTLEGKLEAFPKVEEMPSPKKANTSQKDSLNNHWEFVAPSEQEIQPPKTQETQTSPVFRSIKALSNLKIPFI